MENYYQTKLDNYWEIHNQELDLKIRNGESLDNFPVDELNDLAECYREGACGIKRDIEMAKKLYYHLMLKGHREGARYTMMMALDGSTPVGNIRDAETGDVVDSPSVKEEILAEQPKMQIVGEETDTFKLSLLAAATGDSASCYNLAVQYGLMDGEENYKKAFEYYRIAALQKNAAAISRLAMYYAHGVGVEKNLVLAAYWVFEKYIDCENVDFDTHMEIQQTADFLSENLDWLNKNDDGSFGFAEGFNLIKAAVEEGEPDACIIFYLREEKGQQLIKKSADMGFAPAQWVYAEFGMYDNIEDYFRYLKMACDQGFPEAMADYAERQYKKGKTEEAKKYFLKLLNFGNFKATQDLVDKAHDYLSQIYLNEGNAARALCCYKFTERGMNNQDDANWIDVAKQVFGEPDAGYTPNDDAESNKKTWLWSIVAIIIAAILYFVLW